MSVVILMFSSSVLRVPVGVGLETRLTVAGSMARARLASLASVLIPLSSALESDKGDTKGEDSYKEISSCRV